MIDTLNDIKTKLINREYQNEEHIRFSLVGRIINSLEWNIWNPKEVFTEYIPVPNEDKTKVDIALFINHYNPPSVFIEVKSLGKIDVKLAELQLRDYNRNNTSEFSIITDGQIWRFYYSQTGGEFSDKCFKIINFIEDDIETIKNIFLQFLSKKNIENKSAKNEAEIYLNLSKKQRAMGDVLGKAQKMINEPPFPSLPQALIECVKLIGFEITLSEASDFLKKRNFSAKVNESKINLTSINNNNVENNSKILEDNNGSVKLFMEIKRKNIKAEGVFKNKRIIVLKNSTASALIGDSIPENAKKIRDSLIKDFILTNDPNNSERMIFTQDYTFDSIAAAAGVISGTAINARDNWCDINNNSINALKLFS